MTRTRTMLWTALTLGSGWLALADAQQPYQPPATGSDIQLYSRPLEEEQAASALQESPARPRPDPDRDAPTVLNPAPARPGSGYDDLPPTEQNPEPLPAERSVAPRPVPKVRYEDLPSEPLAPVPDPPPMPKSRYEERPQSAAAAPPPYPDENDSGNDWQPPPGELLDIQNYRGIRYVSGGIGEGERAELDALSSRFNLRLLFAMQGSGSYVADVRVSIRDGRSGLTLVAESKGPWFFADLPPGAYTVEAEAEGQVQRQTVQIGGTAQSRLNFYWR